MSREDAAWLAAAIDGEGWIFIGTRKPTYSWPRVVVGVTNTHKGFVEKAAELMQTKVEGPFFANPNHMAPGGYHSKKGIYRTQARGHLKSLAVLEAIKPFLIIKRTKAQEGIEFIRGRKWGRSTFTSEDMEKLWKGRDESWADPVRRAKRIEAMRAARGLR